MSIQHVPTARTETRACQGMRSEPSHGFHQRPNPSIEGRATSGFASCRPALTSNVRRRIAPPRSLAEQTLLALRVAPAVAAVARLAAFVATSYGQSVQGLAVIVAARCGQSVPPGQEPVAGALSSRRSAVSSTWKTGAGCPSRRRAVSARSCLLVRSGALPRLARGRGTRAHSRP